MTEQNKTAQNSSDVSTFLASVEHPQRREDALVLLEMMTEITGHPAKMWGSSIVGFDSYHYKYDSGREGDFMCVGFSPRKSSMSVYIMPGFSGYDDTMTRLGKHKTGKSCLYINKLADVDQAVLRELIADSYQHMKQKYPD